MRFRSHGSCTSASHSPLTTGDMAFRLGGQWRVWLFGPHALCLVVPGRRLPQAHCAPLPLPLGSPSVIVTHSKRSMGRVTLKCSAFNVNRWGATLTWLCDGDPMHQGIFGPGTILPSGDGTYQTWVTTHVLPGEEHRFICHLRQQGKNTTDPVTSGEKPGKSSSLGSWRQGEGGPVGCTHHAFLVASRIPTQEEFWSCCQGFFSGCCHAVRFDGFGH